MDFDLLVIGGGPVGGHVAGAVAAKGFRVGLLEEHRQVGEPVQCGGLVTPRVFDLVPGKESVLHEVHGAEVFAPSGRSLRVDAGKTHAVVVDRARFDQAIVEDAVGKGARSFLGTRAVAGHYGEDGVEVLVAKDGKQRRVTAGLVVGADGVQSSVAKWFKILRPKHVLPGFEVEMDGIRGDPGFVKVFVGNEVAPGFFGWIIPSGRDTGRVGLCLRQGNAFDHLDRLLRGPAKPFVEHARALRYIAGGIPFGFPSRTYADRVLVVGDAACQVKATSGGGLYSGLRCAALCADTAVRALEEGDLSARRLREYHRAWTRTVGKELRKDLAIFESFTGLSDEAFDQIFDIVNRPEILRLVERMGDIDYPSKLGWALVREEPRLLRYAGRALRAVMGRGG